MKPNQFFKYGRPGLGQFIPDRRHARKLVAIFDMQYPHLNDYIIANVYMARVFHHTTISQQFLVSYRYDQLLKPE